MSENIYYYSFFRNETNKDIVASYFNKRSIPILNKLSDYKMAVLSIDFGDVDAPYFINTEIPLTFNLNYPPDNLNSVHTLFSGYTVAINNYQQLLTEYNRLLAIAWADIIAQYNVIHGVNAWQLDVLKPQGVPGVTFDNATDLFTVWTDKRCEDGNPNAVIWYSQAEFIRLFQGCRLDIFNSPLVSKFTPEVAFANSNIVSIGGIDYIANKQQYCSSSNWSTIRELLLISNTLSCRKEFVGITSGDPGSNMRNVIGNYPISISNAEGGINPSSRIIIYNIVGTPRWIDLIGDEILNQLDFNLWYLTSTGRVEPVILKPNQSFGVKVMFVKI